MKHYLLNRLLCGPIEVLFTLLIFILSKNLYATALQLTIMASLKPMTALGSYYISSFLHGRPQLIRHYLILNSILGVAPCFFFPFTDNVWFYLAAYAIYMITKRAQEPAWMEFLKGHVELPKMSQAVSRGTSITYFINMLLPPILSFWLESEFWKVLFVFLASMQLINLANIFFLKSGSYESRPIKKGIQLLKLNIPFAHYLLLFFLGGAGVLVVQPLLPNYFNENLGLSYAQLTLAFSFCKGISFLISSPYWAKLATRISLFRINAFVNLLICLFIGGLLAASYGIGWLYAAYLFYGAMQGGCDLSWNLSGPIFAKQGDSTPFSSLNLILIGIRGCICPFLGYLIFSYGGIISVFIAAFLFGSAGVIYGLWLDAKQINPPRCHPILGRQ